MPLWAALSAFVQDPWAGVKAWRERRAAMVKPQKPTYDAYPGLSDEPRMTEYIESRDAFGRLLRERVDLKGYGIEHVNFESARWRNDFMVAHQAARKVLNARLRLAKIQKDKRDKERAEEESQRAFERAIALEQRQLREKGQGIVEFALLLPVMLSIFLGMVAVFYLDLSRDRMQDGIEVLAQLASQDASDSWRSLVGSEDARTGCNGGQPVVTYPDGDSAPGHRILLSWHCRLETRWIFDGLPVTVSSEGVIHEP